MSDRTSATLFATIFELLAENPTDEHKKIALQLWSGIGEYDFDNYQMYCDDALVKLDLAEKGPSKDLDNLDDDGKPYQVMFYGPPGNREE